MNRIKGILYAAVSSSTFGLAPFFSLTLLLAGFSAFEVLSYRWGVATIALTLFGWCSGCSFRLEKKDFLVVLLLSLLRAVTSFSLLIAYQNIATGVASTIHFMYPLAVSLVMMYFFQEKKSLWVMFAVFMSLLGAALLSSGELEAKNGDTIVGLVAACVSVFSYAGYIVGVRMTRAVRINSTVLTCYVMGLGTVLYFIGALTTSGSVVILGGLSLVNSLHAYTFASLKRKKLISTTPLHDALNALILALNASAAAFVLLFTKKFRILS